MRSDNAQRLLKMWIRSQHLICEGTDFIFETVDQSHVERFEQCMLDCGGHVREVRAVGNWPMGPKRSFKVLRAVASIPRPGGEELVQYWASCGGRCTRFSEINS
jgi:phycoerythrin-associated linker protein